MTLLLGFAVCGAILLALAAQFLVPIKTIRESLGTLLAADTTSFAPAVNANKIALVKSAFVIDENHVLADFTLADFNGSTAIAGVAGTQGTGLDPVTGEQLLDLVVPAGGWRWVVTGGANLPQTIYGYVLVDNAGANLLGMELLTTPITLTEVGQEVNLGAVNVRFVIQPMS